MLATAGGTACSDIAPISAAPGAMISGFCTPVSVGPALENQQGSPATASRGAAPPCSMPPGASRIGTDRPIPTPLSLTQRGLLMVQPTPMIDGWLAGKLMVP